MRSTLSSQIRPRNYSRGRIAAVICGIYLALVVAAWLFAILGIYLSDPDGGASLAAVYVIVLTAPLSFALIPLEDMVGLLDPAGVIGDILLWSLTLLPGLIQAGIGWLVLRGRRTVDLNGSERAHG